MCIFENFPQSQNISTFDIDFSYRNFFPPQNVKKTCLSPSLYYEIERERDPSIVVQCTSGSILKCNSAASPSSSNKKEIFFSSDPTIHSSLGLKHYNLL